MPAWTAADIPHQTGRVAVITGANSGIGYEMARALARVGSHVVMAARSAERNAAARERILAEIPNATLTLMPLDLASLASVRAFAADFLARFDRLDQLYNNAGLMATPYGRTADGFETQFGVNHLGHFALTGLLLDRLTATPGARVVTTTSQAAFYGRMRFDDPNSEEGYTRYGAYGQSKLANALFAFELQRRLTAANHDTISLAAQPGLAETNLQNATATATGSKLERATYNAMHAVLSQSAEMGALPQLYAGTAPGVKGGEFYTPGPFHVRGYPRRARLTPRAYNVADAARLWALSEKLTGVYYLSG
jgi:NAD(P)-dependent dehydrogenase (short-subunit alcohol dehydrogenase family)